MSKLNTTRKSMKKYLRTFYTLLAIALVFGACNDPTTVGAGIVDDVDLPVKVSEHVVEFSMQEGNPITTWVAPGQGQLNQGQCGIIEDEVFGRTEASISMQFHTLTKQISENEDRIVDSVALILYLDSASTYGNEGPITLEVVRLEEVIDGGESYQADQTFSLGELLATKTFTPDYTEPGEDSDENGPFITIPMPIEIGETLFMLDSAILARDSAFIENFHGIHIRASDVSNHLLGIMPFRSNDEASLTSLRVYYRDTITQDTSNTFILSPTLGYFISPVIQHFAYDYTGSLVEQNLNNFSDSVLYIQGNGGVNVNMSVPGLPDLGDISVNKAELFIPFNESLLPYSLYPQLKTIFLTIENINGTRQFIPEYFETNTFRFSPIGRLDTINGTIGYTYNFPFHAQNLIDGTIFSNEMRLQSVAVPQNSDSRSALGPFNLKESSARSVIFGRKNHSEAICLKITYTEN